MTKAFKKESDQEEVSPEIVADTTKNYVTPAGLIQLQNEYRTLLNEERPKVVETVRWAAGNGDRSENGDYIYGKKRLREIDRRLRYLKKRLQSVEVVDPEKQQHLTKVYFGATITYLQANGSQMTLQLVGIDEADLKQHKISWNSPVAKALMKAEVGDEVKIKTPSGVQSVEIIAIKYV